MPYNLLTYRSIWICGSDANGRGLYAEVSLSLLFQHLVLDLNQFLSYRGILDDVPFSFWILFSSSSSSNFNVLLSLNWGVPFRNIAIIRGGVTIGFFILGTRFFVQCNILWCSFWVLTWYSSTKPLDLSISSYANSLVGVSSFWFLVRVFFPFFSCSLPFYTFRCHSVYGGYMLVLSRSRTKYKNLCHC